MSMFQAVYVADGRLQAPFFPTKEEPYIEGFLLQVPSQSGAFIEKFTATWEMEFMSIAVGASRYDDFDCFDLKVRGKLVLKSIYTKKLPEGMFLMVAHPINPGDVIEFVFHNKSAAQKNVWFNLQFLTD
jgi:hypothetical protein